MKCGSVRWEGAGGQNQRSPPAHVLAYVCERQNTKTYRREVIRIMSLTPETGKKLTGETKDLQIVRHAMVGGREMGCRPMGHDL